ncbi:hypothetical protein FACS1894185_6640 [Betaproteobacteria bacterium]|nr:hypothetical protein FACS1894185_6640 [Betaproteobacteria bacterium]GHU15406.1 hypothetical protein FACS189441_7020 [Betaproteobacteria bacterium]
MDVINIAAERSQIEIDRDELLILNAAINEVCNGIAVFEFDTRIGADRESVAVLLKEIGSLLDKMDLLQK